MDAAQHMVQAQAMHLELAAAAADLTYCCMLGQMDAAQQYNTNGRGYLPLLDWAKQHTQQLQAPPAGQEVVITSGSNHAIDVCFSTLQPSLANLPTGGDICAIGVCSSLTCSCKNALCEHVPSVVHIRISEQLIKMPVLAPA